MLEDARLQYWTNKCTTQVFFEKNAWENLSALPFGSAPSFCRGKVTLLLKELNSIGHHVLQLGAVWTGRGPLLLDFQKKMSLPARM